MTTIAAMTRIRQPLPISCYRQMSYEMGRVQSIMKAQYILFQHWATRNHQETQTSTQMEDWINLVAPKQYLEVSTDLYIVPNSGFKRVYFQNLIIILCGTFKKIFIYLFIYLFGYFKSQFRILHASCGIFLCGTWTFFSCCEARLSTEALQFWSMQAQQLQHTGPVAPWHVGILVSPAGIESSCPALQGGFLTTGQTTREIPMRNCFCYLFMYF